MPFFLLFGYILLPKLEILGGFGSNKRIFCYLCTIFYNKVINMKKIIFIVSILFVAIVITTIAYALFDFNHENLIIIFFSSLISIIITEYVRKRIS